MYERVYFERASCLNYLSGSVLGLFLTVPWIVLQCLIVLFPDTCIFEHLVWLERASCLNCLSDSAPGLFLTVPWTDLQCLIVVFSDHTHFLFS